MVIGLRSEWAKAYARAERWKEEHLLVMEEMRRVLQYCKYKSTWWNGQAERRQVSEDFADGLRAYSCKQADVWLSLGKTFSSDWLRWIAYHGDMASSAMWPPEFHTVVVQQIPDQLLEQLPDRPVVENLDVFADLNNAIPFDD